MSNDIVERLRMGWPNTLEITDEAADEIERLRVENWQLKGALGYPVPGHIMDNSDFKCGLCDAKTNEIAALRARLRADAPFNAVEDYQQFRKDNPDTVTVDE